MKEKIAAEKGWEASQQKLIYSGRLRSTWRIMRLVWTVDTSPRQDSRRCKYRGVLQHRGKGLHSMHDLQGRIYLAQRHKTLSMLINVLAKISSNSNRQCTQSRCTFYSIRLVFYACRSSSSSSTSRISSFESSCFTFASWIRSNRTTCRNRY